jgi:hypothetical protein
LSPDVRLALLDSDLLFVHGSDTLDFSGILALSTYPPASPSWPVEPLHPSASRRYYFASSKTEGVYNACIFLLNRLDPGKAVPRDYSAPDSPKTPNGNATPPVWLSIIGRDAYWPLGFLKSSGDGMRDAKAIEARLDPGQPTRAWSFIFYFCSLLAGLYIAIYLFALKQEPKALSRWCSLLHPRPYPADTTVPPNSPSYWRAGYSFNLSFALWLAYLNLLAPVLRLVLVSQPVEWVVMPIIGGMVCLGFLTVLRRGLAFLPQRMVRWNVALGSLASLYLIYFSLGTSFDQESFFRALRSVQLGSGVGPNLPFFFLFLAFAWWASIQIQRARLGAEHAPESANVAANDAMANVGPLNEWLQQPFLHVDRPGVGVALFVAAIAAVVTLLHVVSVDGWLFDGAICVVLIPLSSLLFLTTYAFARIWWTLDRFLKALETEPIRFAFSNLPTDVSWSPLWEHGARRNTYATSIRSLESLRSLKATDADYYPRLSDDIDDLEGDLKKILKPVHQGIEESLADTFEAQNLLREIAMNLSKETRTREWKTDHSGSLEKLKKASGSPTVHKGIASWLHPGKPAELAITSAPEDSEPPDKAEMLAAEVIALGYLSYIRYVMRHLRNLLSFITTGFILMTLALNCYPFQMLNMIRWSITIVFILIAVVLLYAFQEMSRNEILSRITDTKAGSLDAGFYSRLVSVGALPVVAVVASHFPSVGRFLFSWVQPAISAVH